MKNHPSKKKTHAPIEGLIEVYPDVSSKKRVHITKKQVDSAIKGAIAATDKEMQKGLRELLSKATLEQKLSLLFSKGEYVLPRSGARPKRKDAIITLLNNVIKFLSHTLCTRGVPG
ncbi:MAG TPA: hypothetical protein VD905_10195 [Flavobacteriales bacterium]|nr:hypothetical protein [Flavobacteriales bacterium]